jgi:hypothetical protein
MVVQQRLVLLSENGGIGERDIADHCRLLQEEACPNLLFGEPLGGERRTVKDNKRKGEGNCVGTPPQKAEPVSYPRLPGPADELEVLLEDPSEDVLSYPQSPVFDETSYHSALPETVFIAATRYCGRITSPMR